MLQLLIEARRLSSIWSIYCVHCTHTFSRHNGRTLSTQRPTLHPCWTIIDPRRRTSHPPKHDPAHPEWLRTSVVSCTHLAPGCHRAVACEHRTCSSNCCNRTPTSNHRHRGLPI